MDNWKQAIDECNARGERILYEERAAAREWVYSKWHSYKDRFLDLTWRQRIDFFLMFKRWLFPVSKCNESYDDALKKLGKEFIAKALDELFKEYEKKFLWEVKKTYLHNPRKCRMKRDVYKTLLKEICQVSGPGREKTLNRAYAKIDAKYRETIQPLLENVRVDDPDKVFSTTGYVNEIPGMEIEDYHVEGADQNLEYMLDEEI